MADDNENVLTSPVPEILDKNFGPSTASNDPEDNTSPVEEPTDETGTEETEDEDQSSTETVDLELDGVTYTVPKALEAHFLREADYTQKTQELSAQRQAWEAERASVAEKVQFQEAFVREVAQIHGLEAQLKEYDNVDWQRYVAENPQAANQDWILYQQLKENYGAATNHLRNQVEAFKSKQQEEASVQVQKSREALSKPIPEYFWPGASDKHLQELTDFAKGVMKFSDAQIARTVDPKGIMVLNLAMMSYKQLTAAQKAAFQKNVRTAEPVKQVVSQRAKPRTSISGDELSAEQWLARERKREAAKLNGSSR